MAERMGLQQDLTAMWERIVRAGQIRNQFVSIHGRRIESGIRMTVSGPQHYALDLQSGEEIGAGVLERTLEGSTFILQLNQYRALKPKADSLGLGRQPDVSPDAKDCFFACQDPTNPLSLLRRTIHLQTAFLNYQWSAVHNVLPVEKNGHFLWIPVSAYGAVAAFPHWIQMLTLPLLQDFVELAVHSSGVMTFFNSMHAGGSVNHIHYHSVYRERRLPVEEAATVLLGGHLFLDGYPASGLVYPEGTPAEDIWRHVAKLQERGIPINLIHAGERTYLFARNIDNERVPEFPSAILAGMELSGRAITTEESFYRQAGWATIQLALRKSTLRNEDVLAML